MSNDRVRPPTVFGPNSENLCFRCFNVLHRNLTISAVFPTESDLWTLLENPPLRPALLDEVLRMNDSDFLLPYGWPSSGDSAFA